MQLSYHRGATLTPQDVGHGIVFVLARWSPDAVARFDELHAELARAEYMGKVIVIDMDATALDVIELGRTFGLAIHGWGEAFAVDHDRVVARSSAEEGSSLADLCDRLNDLRGR